jgi:hypothetical protein
MTKRRRHDDTYDYLSGPCAEFASKVHDLVIAACEADEPGPVEVARLLFAEAGALMSACVGREAACQWVIDTANSVTEDRTEHPADRVH